MEETKECSICFETKPLTDFNVNVATKTGRRAQCKKCRAAYDAARYAADTRRERHLRKFYNLTPEQYETLAENGCNVCGKADERLSVDHDHKCCAGWKSCGKCVRGVLCAACNKAEGLLGSDPERIDALAAYLRKTSVTQVTDLGVARDGLSM